MIFKGSQKIVGETFTLQKLLKTIYPVGSVIISFNERDLNNEIMGTEWELIDNDYYLVATKNNDVGSIVDEELPAIIGEIGYKGMLDGQPNLNNGKQTGALSVQPLKSDNGGNLTTSQSYSTNTNYGIKLDSSKVYTKMNTYTEHKVYKVNGKVKPKSIKVYIYRRVI